MATYKEEVFRWSGTGYNATYKTSYQAEFTDDDKAYQGSGDKDETVSIDGKGPFATTGSPYAIKVPFTAVDGSDHVEVFYFFNASGGGGWYFIPGPGSAFSVGAELGFYGGHTVGWTYADVICFTPGARIATPTGKRPVESLAVGDLVITRDNGLQAVRWIGRKPISGARLAAYPNLQPIRICKGALGRDLPKEDILVSPQHRVLLRGTVCATHFGQREVLAPARGLVNGNTVFTDHAVRSTQYVHVLFDRHEVIFANDLPTESFHPGAMGLQAIDAPCRAELFQIFPELAENPRNYGPAARKSLRVKEARILAGAAHH